MSNAQLIKSAYIWALVLIVLFAAIVFAGKPGSISADSAQQNTNSNTQNQNANQNANANANANANTSRNRNENNSNATGDQTATGGMSQQDHKFAMEAAMGGLMEVQLGRWAAQKGTSEAVKTFGRRMVTDHTQANTELRQLASSKGMTLPTELDAKHQREVSSIVRQNGAEFDRAYAKRMVRDHNKKLSAFEKQSTRGDDADLKAFAAKTLPTIREHLEMARALTGDTGAGNVNVTTNRNDNINSNDNSNTNSNSNGNRNSNRNRNNNGNGNGNSNRP